MVGFGFDRGLRRLPQSPQGVHAAGGIWLRGRGRQLGRRERIARRTATPEAKQCIQRVFTGRLLHRQQALYASGRRYQLARRVAGGQHFTKRIGGARCRVFGKRVPIVGDAKAG